MPVDIRDMKRRTALEFYKLEPIFKVVLDVRTPGVLLPDNWMKADPPVIHLDLGYGLARPIKDLTIDVEGISGTLSFGTTPFFCRVPWDAVGALAVEGAFALGWQPLGVPLVEVEVVRTAKSRSTKVLSVSETVAKHARSKFKVIDGGVGQTVEPATKRKSDSNDGGAGCG